MAQKKRKVFKQGKFPKYMNKKILMPIVLILLVFGGVLVSARNLTEESLCFNSDGGINYQVRGYVSDKYTLNLPEQKLWDSCAIEDTGWGSTTFVGSCNGTKCFLTEFFCIGSNHDSINVPCPMGCFNGTCEYPVINETEKNPSNFSEQDNLPFQEENLNAPTFPPEGLPSEVSVKCLFFSYSLDEILNSSCFIENKKEISCRADDLKILNTGRNETPYYRAECSFKMKINSSITRPLFLVGKTNSDSFKLARELIPGPIDEYDSAERFSQFRFCWGQTHPSPYGGLCDNRDFIYEEESPECFFVGVRYEGNYCSPDLKIQAQKVSGEYCENNFECTSNVCISGKCIDEGFIQRILNWFKRLFGGN
jgi:hypothetical protein